jgi:hypothetical protein
MNLPFAPMAPLIALPLSQLALIAARGADAETFLQGQLSNDVRGASAAHGQLSSYNSAKGRMLAVLHLLREGDAILLELHRSILESTLKRLRMYVLRSKVTLAEAADRVLFGVAGRGAPDALAKLGLPAPEDALACDWAGGIGVMRRLGATPRYSLLVPSPGAQDLGARLSALAQAGTETDWKRLDLEAGVPTIYPQTQDRFVPQMCNLDALGGISFDKGCYTGQEVVARVHYRGAVKRHMTLQRLAGAAAAPGTKLEVGEVVDAVDNADGSASALVVAV